MVSMRFWLFVVMVPFVPATLEWTPFEWKPEDEENTDVDPWTPCRQMQNGEMTDGFCRLSCTAKSSHNPKLMNCRQLPKEALLRRSHSRGLESFQKLSSESFSQMNSGLGDDPQ